LFDSFLAVYEFDYLIMTLTYLQSTAPSSIFGYYLSSTYFESFGSFCHFYTIVGTLGVTPAVGPTAEGPVGGFRLNWVDPMEPAVPGVYN
jgi:hypothetical protein